MSSTMNSSQKKRLLSLDLRLFESAQLTKDGGVEQAILNLENVIYGGEASQAITDLLSSHNLFEFIFSVANDGVVEALRQHMLDRFPSTAAEFASSHFSFTLPRLASFLYFLSTEDEKSQSLADGYRIANSIPGMLEILSSAAFREHAVNNSSLDQQEEDDFLEFGTKKRNQRQAKQLKKARKVGPRLDPRLLEASRIAGMDVPKSRKEADDLALCLLDRVKGALCDFLDLLRDSKWASSIREAYIPSIEAPHVDVYRNHSSDQSTDVLQETSEGSSAFPSVQPLKAALHFENAKGLGDWRIFISNKAEKHLREHRKNPKTFKVIIKKIRELSHGHFSADNQKRLRGPDKGVPIFEAKMTGDLRLVYHVDCSSDYETEVEWQALRIFGVFTHAQMDERMWASLSAQLGKKGPEYRKRVISRSKPTNTSDNIFEPLSWPDHSVREEESRDEPALLSLIRPDDLPNIHQWVVLEKYTAFSQALLNCILADKAASAVFTVTPYERAVIEHPSSCFVLGRSGTGKTTTMLFKIFGIERSARLQHAEILKKPRQLFVTQSRVLAGRVKDYFDKLSDFLCAATAKSLTDLKELGHSYEEIQHDDDLGDPEDDEEWRDDLPKRFSELEDKHFPLFLTFDKLCKLIEADQGLSFGRQKYTREHRRAERRYTSKGAFKGDLNDLEVMDTFEEVDSTTVNYEQSRASLVTYEAFCSRYWPHFPQNLTKGLDTALVFNEFMGVIKGSEECLLSEKPYLSRETYLGLSERTQSTFASQRTRIYELFVSYLKLKQQYDDYDSADRSFAIISHLQDIRKIGVDYLYVDEAQDNLIIDALLLRSLCSNPDGLFWAGDTAQTIAVGSSFRFDDLKASLYRFETSNPGGVSQKPHTKPTSFQLTTNYRSHGGIVNCAEMVIRLIKNFWPHSIDMLRQEKGLVDGEKPVIITGWTEENARYEQFLLGEDGSSIEFGAQQCILVRHDRARNNLRKQVGEIGVILTIYESKGLEFDDVLLFNFFEDSLCDASQWRVILNYGSTLGSYGVAPPSFDEVRHAGICAELKFLYVAMTRARKNLWIIDRSERMEPMKLLLDASGRVTICSPEMAPKLSVTSTTEEWAKTGKELFRNQRYSQAMHCFERSGHTYERSIAEAYYLRQQARIQDSGRKAAFLVAAKAFCACAVDSPALIRRKDYYRIAADCYREADDFGSAASAFLHAEEYNHASRFFRKAGMFDDAVKVIKSNRGSVDQVLAEEIIDVSKVHYFHENKLELAMELFESKEDGLSFMEEYGFNLARSKVLEAIGCKREAAELYISEGHQRDAMRVLLSDPDDAPCIQQASTIVLGQLWRKYAFSSAPVKNSQGEVDYEALAGSLLKSRISAKDRKQFDIFFAIKKRDTGSLFCIQDECFRDGDMLNTTLILNHYLCNVISVKIGSMEDLLPILRACARYADCLRSLIDAPHSKPKVQQLLGFTPVPERAEYAIDEYSLLHSQAVADKIRGSFVDGSLVIHELDMPALIKASLTSHLRSFVRKQNQWLLTARDQVFGTPCPLFAIRGTCYLNQCQKQHVDVRAVDVQWYNLRIRLHYLQILHIGAANFSLDDWEQSALRGQWIANLFEICHPLNLSLGSLVNISPSLTPETEDAIRLIGYWLEVSFYMLNSDQALPTRHRISSQSRTFLDNVTELAVIGLHYDATRFRDVIRRSMFYDKDKGHPSLFRQDVSSRAYVIHDLIPFIDAYDLHFLNRGILFVKHVINSKMSMDINHLCYLFEQLCSCSILINAYQRYGLHNCTLPRSWIRVNLQKLRDQTDMQQCSPGNIWMLLDIIFQRLRQLVYEPDSVYKNTSIARLCQCIILLGYNLGINSLREKIVGSFIQLRKDISYPPWSLKQPRYIYCNGWPDLARIVRTLVPNTRLDNMVQLVKKGRTMNSLSTHSTIVRVEFLDCADILSTLSDEHNLSKSQLSATATPFTPKEAVLVKAMEPKVQVDRAGQIPSSEVLLTEGLAAPREAGCREEEEESEEEEVEEEEDREPEVLLENVTEVPEDAEPVIVRHSEAELAAANIIWGWYKAVMIQRSARPSLTHRQIAMKFHLAQIYTTCLKSLPEKIWSSRLHRIVFLGPLPHILLCLDKVQDRLQADRKRAIVAINNVAKENHIEYDEIMRRMAQTRQRRKRLDSFKKLFNPTSNFHTTWVLEELRCNLRDVESLIDEVKVGDVLEITENLLLAKKAIIEERKVATQEPEAKPELNTEDIYDFEDY